MDEAERNCDFVGSRRLGAVDLVAATGLRDAKSEILRANRASTSRLADAKVLRRIDLMLRGQMQVVDQRVPSRGPARWPVARSDKRRCRRASIVGTPSKVDVASRTYNTNGNMTEGLGVKTMTWDAENRLVSVTSGRVITSYVFGADGARLKRTSGGETTLSIGTMEVRKAARVARSLLAGGRPMVGALVTVDAVSLGSRGSIPSGVAGYWIDIRARPGHLDQNDYIAQIGANYSAREARCRNADVHIISPLHHGDFGGMLGR